MILQTQAAPPDVPDIQALPDDALLKTSKVAALCDVNSATIRRWVHESRFPAPVRGEGHWRFRVADIRTQCGGMAS
ncbi:helix-turn-helix domain-containing protein [Burkholderia sp. AU19243]|nr:helix-turn-helix domain-containing protein [Burkholderia vietnamiensis]MBR8367371.1 helix-turn-helix domain-containing protein [Burkholderia sp. AU19243]